MKVAISKLPKKPWWGTGIIGYKDNPAMRHGIIPDQNLLFKERENLINTLENNNIEVIQFSFPEELENKRYGHDFVFLRDAFISDLNMNVLLLKFSQKNRYAELKKISDYLEKLNYNITEIPNRKNVFAEGGEFYYCPKDKVLFSGLKRNSISGAEEVASFLNVNKLILIKTKAFHLDTVFTTIMDRHGRLCAVIVCKDLISKDSFDLLIQFSRSNSIDIINIPPVDSIGIKNNIGSLAVNNFSAPGLLISSCEFSEPTVSKYLNSKKIKMETTPVTQFQLSGGSIHCLTNEL